MGRAPCCEKVGLNRGSWTPEEDKRLMTYIYQHGHANWRSLPKQAGLLRCGKSCRLRWINYLRPDIKRGNFTPDEEETLIKLHASLGNKWSKIALCMPGRTDNEIKNVWNTHLKKRVSPKNTKLEEPAGSMSSSSLSSISSTDQDKKQTPIQPINIEQSLSSSASSANVLEEMIPDMPIELEFWDVIDEDSFGLFRPEVEPCGGKDSESSKGWLEALEKELDMWGPSLVEMEGDPVTTYFQTSPSCDELVDCPDAML